MADTPTCDLPPLAIADRDALLAVRDLVESRMQPATPDEIGRNLAVAFAAFPSKPISDADASARRALYLDGLADVPRSLLDEAFRRCIRQCSFFPTVAELREAVATEMGQWRREAWEIKRLLTAPEAA